ncbi:META domain-containing protein [Pseudomaricurvus alcaniphilus]|uniref:META domain-containing protein n=1 Tax=Pseudomaricurvus alcaniphilus TaxID=1166482 RepID=UPI001408052B|nr:META domain-containing protein [Pseudomaricurvus alcaniphilus]NHN36171.1 META domain-containing protein [Pseudomaricurvus alcaniphilus]
MTRYLRHCYPILIAAAAALALAACTSAPGTGTNGNSEFTNADLLDRTFQIQDVAGRGVIDSSHITLTFGQDGQFSGSTGCNRVFGPYTRSGADLEFGTLGTTRKMCPPALMNQEQTVLNILADVIRIERDREGALLVTTADGRSLRGFESTQSALHTYFCDDGATVKATYPTKDKARIVYKGQTFDTTITQSASGSRYTGGGWEWWSKGRVEAHLAPLAAGETIASARGITCRK